MSEIAVYAGLFALSFVAATLFPGQSEAGLAGLIIADNYSIAWLIIAASAGNTLGSVINWLLGRGIDRLHDRPWFPVSPARLEKTIGWYRRYGRWSLLLSWMPVIGDPLTLVAGVLREPFASFLVLVAVAKTGRYLVIAGLALQWIDFVA